MAVPECQAPHSTATNAMQEVIKVLEWNLQCWRAHLLDDIFCGAIVHLPGGPLTAKNIVQRVCKIA